MTDGIASGSGPPRRRSVAALTLVAAVLFGFVLSHRLPAARPQASPPVQAPVRQVITSVPRADLFGNVRAGPSGLRLLVDGTDPKIVDAGTLAVTRVPGLVLRPGQTARVLQFGSAGLVALVPRERPTGGIYLLRPGQPPMLLGGWGVYVPGRDGTVVAASYRQGSTTVTGLDFDRRVRWRWSRLGKAEPLRDTPAGLVVAQHPEVGDDAELLLLDRRTGLMRRSLGHAERVVATDDRSVAWTPGRCDPDCLLIRTELATGAARGYRMPGRREPEEGAFAPDGQRLALSFSGTLADTGTPAEPGFAGILDLRTSALTSVPGLATPPSNHADVTWSAEGRWLVLGVKWPEEELIAIWRPGSEVTILPLALPGEPTTATLTALR